MTTHIERLNENVVVHDNILERLNENLVVMTTY